MKQLFIDRGDDTLEVKLKKEDGLISFTGKSYPEDIEKFFVPILDWIEEYMADPHDSTKVVFDLEYFNTATSRKFLEILIELEKLPESGKDVVVQWLYNQEDEDIYSAGKKCSVLSRLPFEIQQV
ncbi:MAG: DUF1987 domain-containing protein [Bacteroidales bacterium]|nr:DUF1987 domain-containing protein [Bacteroidales bacterium]